MKYLITTALIFYVLVGCTKVNSEPTLSNIETTQPNKYVTVVIDGCEYLQWTNKHMYGYQYSVFPYETKMITHKGNCKYCITRNK